MSDAVSKEPVNAAAMDRLKMNDAIDFVSFVLFVLLSVTGFIMRYLLPPGSGRIVGEGTGWEAAQKPVALLWGMTRHGWGNFHFWLAVAFLAVLATHLILHWRWIVCRFRGEPREGSGIRLALGILGVSALVVVSAAPLMSPIERVARIELQEIIEVSRSGHEPAADDMTEADLRGSMTVREVSQKMAVPVEVLKERLGLPKSVSDDEPLSRLMKAYGFRMKDVRRVTAGSRPSAPMPRDPGGE